MKIYLNGGVINCREQISLLAFLNEHGVETDNIAVAVNDVVVSKTLWETFIIKDGSSILIIKATQGG